MRIFLTGANGWVGSAVARELIGAGHQIIGLVRSEEKADRLRRDGLTPIIGSLSDHDVLRKAAQDSDGIIHTAFGLDLSRMDTLAQEDREAIEIFGEAYEGSYRPIVVTGGIDLSQDGDVFTEDARPPVDPNFPRASEQTAFSLSDRGIVAMTVRLGRSVHGIGETHGFVPMLAQIARDTGISAYIGDGESLWPAVHRLDAARLFRTIVERPQPGEAFHAVAENVPVRAVVQAIGRQLGVPVRSLSEDQASEHFGVLAPWIGGSAPASNERTKKMTGWRPEHPSLLTDIDQSEYYE